MRIERNLNNKYLVLLTEVLPYELPLMLNNDAFYENMQEESLRKTFLDVFNGIVNLVHELYHLIMISEE